MAKDSLVEALQHMFRCMVDTRGVSIDGASLMPAYEGMVDGLYILTVSMPDGKACADKIDCLIRSIHEFVDLDLRKMIAGVRVFDTRQEFDQFARFGYLPDACDVCEQSMPSQRQNTKPQEFGVFA